MSEVGGQKSEVSESASRGTGNGWSGIFLTNDFPDEDGFASAPQTKCLSDRGRAVPGGEAVKA